MNSVIHPISTYEDVHMVISGSPVIWKRNCGEDSYGNKLFEVMFPNYTYRGVVLPHGKSRRKRRWRIFLKKNTYIDIRIKLPYSECDTEDMSIGNYEVGWGDIDNMGAEGPNNEIVNQLKQILCETFCEELCTCIVLRGIQHDDEEWKTK